MSLGAIVFFRGDFVRARTLLDDSVTLARSAEDMFVVAFSLGLTALGELELGDLATAVRRAAEGQEAARASPEPWVVGPALSCLAYVALHEGDLDRAGGLHEECLDLSRQRGDSWAMGISLFDLALLRVVQQRYDEARALCAEGIALYQTFGDLRGIAWCLGILSGADAADGQSLRAARLRGAMEGLLESVGAPPQVSYHTWIGDRSLALMRQSLGESGAQEAIAEGRAMSLARAIEFSLGGERGALADRPGAPI
jgi:hypothetical protein